jgi:acyl-CoA thioester hydrolase
MEEFSHVETVPVRYCDLDTMGHANNAVYATYCEEARVGYLRATTDRPFREWFADHPFVLASLSLDFRASVRDDDEVRVGVGVTDLGRSSFRMAYEVRAGEAVAATAESVQVSVDAETREARPLAVAWRRNVADREGIDPGGDAAAGTE